LGIGTFLFAIQIYCDFSGYSDIAIGTARLFGMDIKRNFAYPYFSRDVAEFWRRWHISLSSWFRDYVYIPLGGSRTNKSKKVLNIIITFTVSGFWHGANWTFIVWGFINGLYYIPLMLLEQQRKHTNIVSDGKFFPSPHEFIQMLSTFFLVLFAWIFFRAESISHAFDFILHMFSNSWLVRPNGKLLASIFYSLLLLMVEWFQRMKPHALAINSLSPLSRWFFYILISVVIFILGNLSEVEFIYFQF